MTKADIVNEISRTTGIEKVAVQATVEAFMESIKNSVVEGKNVYLRGFGSFVVKKRAEKTARNISGLYLYYFVSFSAVSAICSGVSPFALSTSPASYLSRNSFFRPRLDTFMSESP